MKKLHVGFSFLTSEIFAGELLEDGVTWGLTDITEDALGGSAARC